MISPRFGGSYLCRALVEFLLLFDFFDIFGAEFLVSIRLPVQVRHLNTLSINVDTTLHELRTNKEIAVGLLSSNFASIPVQSK
jgi:hypothetical protein